MASGFSLTHHDKLMLSDGFQYSKSYNKKRKFNQINNNNISNNNLNNNNFNDSINNNINNNINYNKIYSSFNMSKEKSNLLNPSSQLPELLQDEYKKHHFEIEFFEKKIRNFKQILKKDSNINLFFTNEIMKKVIPFDPPQRKIKTKRSKSLTKINPIIEPVYNSIETTTKHHEPEISDHQIIQNEMSSDIQNSDMNSEILSTDSISLDNTIEYLQHESPPLHKKISRKKSPKKIESNSNKDGEISSSNIQDMIPKEMYIYGIGDLNTDASIFQFAYCLSMLSSSCGNRIKKIFLYDPIIYILYDDESLINLKNHLKSKYNIIMLETNDECKKKIDEACIIYMPHCPKILYYNILKENWKNMNHFILIGNILPLPSNVIKYEWDFTTIFPNFSRHDISHYGLNNTSIYLLKSGSEEEFYKFEKNYNLTSSYYISKEMCS